MTLCEELYNVRSHPDDEESMKNYDPGSEHPTIEQLFIRASIEHLTEKQRVIWDYHNLDKLTTDQIAEKLGISHQAVSAHIRAAEERIKKWCDENRAAYDVLKDSDAKP